MEKMTLLLPENTAEMLHLLSRETGQNIGDLVQEMALDRYMKLALGGADVAVSNLSDMVCAETAYR
jgi:hypothetical protein